MSAELSPSPGPMIAVVVDTAIIGKDAVLKACYWFGREFRHELATLSDGRIQVNLFPKESADPDSITTCQEEFLNMAIDFELRSQIEQRTSPIRELILAKAFAASGVLEETPQGEFADRVEEEKPDGLFKILSSGHF